MTSPSKGHIKVHVQTKPKIKGDKVVFYVYTTVNKHGKKAYVRFGHDYYKTGKGGNVTKTFPGSKGATYKIEVKSASTKYYKAGKSKPKKVHVKG